MTVQGATFNMHGQLYAGHANVTTSLSSPAVSALGSKLDDLGSSPSQGKALCPNETCRKKKMRAPLLGLAKSIYYQCLIYIWKLTGFMSKKDWAINVVRKLSCAKRMDSKSLVLLIFSTSWLYCASSTSTCIPTQPREHHGPLWNKVK